MKQKPFIPSPLHLPCSSVFAGEGQPFTKSSLPYFIIANLIFIIANRNMLIAKCSMLIAFIFLPDS